MRTSLSAGLPTRTAPSISTRSSRTFAATACRNDHAPDGGAFLAGLLRDVALHFLQEQFVHVAAVLDVGAEHGRVQAVGFHVDPHRMANDVGQRADALAGFSRTREGEHVLRAEQGGQVARAADEERERALGKDFRVHQDFHDAVGEHGGTGGRLAEHRHAGEQRGGRLLGEAPGRKVERVDVHRDARARHAHVLAVEARRAAELQAFAVDEESRRAQLLADLRVGEQRSDGAFHVELSIRAGVAAVGDREVEQFVAMRLHRLRHAFQQRAALGERKRAQRRARRRGAHDRAPRRGRRRRCSPVQAAPRSRGSAAPAAFRCPRSSGRRRSFSG